MKTREVRRIWGKPWDYSYLLAIEQRKLKEMADYFQKSKLTTGWEFQVRDCRLCVKLIDIILEKDKPTSNWLDKNFGDLKNRGPYHPFTTYVNTWNKARFNNSLEIEKDNLFLLDNALIDIRKTKALYLYHKIRMYNMETWWD